MIYFIQAGEHGPIKIGYCRTWGGAETRRRTLQTGNPDQLVLLATIPGNRAEEKALHGHFERQRLAGEWFAPDRHLQWLVAVAKDDEERYAQSLLFANLMSATFNGHLPNPAFDEVVDAYAFGELR